MVYYVSVVKENSAYTFVAKTKEEAEEHADEVRQEAISVTISQE